MRMRSPFLARMITAVLLLLRRIPAFTVSSSSNFQRLLLGATAASSTTTDTATAPPYKVPAKFVQFPFAYHELVELDVESLTNRGWGLGRVDVPPKEEERDDAASASPAAFADDDAAATEPQDNRWVVMVPNVIPGERVAVRIFRNFRTYSEGDLHAVLTPSPDRIAEPPCSHAMECGGCQFQHMSIEAQREWKTLAVQQAMEQYTLHDQQPNITVAPTIGTEHTFGYRSKLTPHYQAPSKRQLRNNQTHVNAVGFQRKTNRQVLDIPECIIATPAINTLYAETRTAILADPVPRKKGATLLFRQGQLDDDTVTTTHQDMLTTSVNGRNFTYQAGNFFQNNYYALSLLVDVVRQACITAPQGSDLLVDCYCGSGLFAISCADLCQDVVGIEINAKAVAEATANAAQNGITNCAFTAAATPDALFASLAARPSIVILDPPRKGCGSAFVDQLLTLQPDRIIYVACDPVTQARDVAELLLASGKSNESQYVYELTSVQPIDLFPQTRHIENVMVLDRCLVE